MRRWNSGGYKSSPPDVSCLAHSWILLLASVPEYTCTKYCFVRTAAVVLGMTGHRGVIKEYILNSFTKVIAKKQDYFVAVFKSLD